MSNPKPASPGSTVPFSRPIERDPPTVAPPHIPDYELLREIGRGGSGAVWIVRNRVDKRYYALKLFPRRAMLEIEGLREYKRRAKDHPHLVPIHHVGEVGEWCYYVMPLADDACEDNPVIDPEQYEPRTLARVLDRRGQLSVEEVLDAGAQICSALVHLHHNGARHGDVKPGNVVARDRRWQLADQGLVSNAERDGPVAGTPEYAAPEGLGGRSADLFALGKTLFELVTGEVPTDVDHLLSGKVRISTGDPRDGTLEDVIHRACATDPDDRYQHPSEMLTALEQALAVTEPTPRERDAASKRSPLRPAVAGIATIVVLVVIWRIAFPPEGPPAAPIEVNSLRLHHYKGEAEELVGLIGISSERARFEEDAISIEVDFSAGAHCYILALNPDGTIQLCHPADEDRTPPKSKSVNAPLFPDGRLAVFPLNDGVGAQGFIVVASRDALPSYRRWKKTLGRLPWEPFETDGVWRSDGEKTERFGADRGDRRARRGAPQPFMKTLAALKRVPKIDHVEGIVFPVVGHDAD